MVAWIELLLLNLDRSYLCKTTPCYIVGMRVQSTSCVCTYSFSSAYCNHVTALLLNTGRTGTICKKLPSTFSTIFQNLFPLLLCKSKKYWFPWSLIYLMSENMPLGHCKLVRWNFIVVRGIRDVWPVRYMRWLNFQLSWPQTFFQECQHMLINRAVYNVLTRSKSL